MPVTNCNLLQQLTFIPLIKQQNQPKTLNQHQLSSIQPLIIPSIHLTNCLVQIVKVLATIIRNLDKIPPFQYTF